MRIVYENGLVRCYWDDSRRFDLGTHAYFEAHYTADSAMVHAVIVSPRFEKLPVRLKSQSARGFASLTSQPTTGSRRHRYVVQ